MVFANQTELCRHHYWCQLVSAIPIDGCHHSLSKLVAAILTVVAETVAVAVEVIAAATALAAVAAPAEFEPATDQHKEDKSSELAIAASPLSKLAHQIWLQLLPSRQ